MTHDESIEEGFDDLNDLIRYLEQEKDRLKRCVEKAAGEWEFLEAKAFAKAHGRVAGRLRVLRILKDPNFEKRAYYYNILVSLEEQLKTYAKVPHLVTRFKQELDQTNRALDELENKKHFQLDTQHIDDALFDLVHGKILNFKLHLNKSEKLVLNFVCMDKRLHVTFTYKKGSIFPSIKKNLRRVGFSKIDGARKFTREIDVTNFKDSQGIKTFLAVVVFDVLGRSWIDHPAELEIDHAPPFEGKK